MTVGLKCLQCMSLRFKNVCLLSALVLTFQLALLDTLIVLSTCTNFTNGQADRDYQAYNNISQAYGLRYMGVEFTSGGDCTKNDFL